MAPRTFVRMIAEVTAVYYDGTNDRELAELIGPDRIASTKTVKTSVRCRCRNKHTALKITLNDGQEVVVTSGHWLLAKGRYLDTMSDVEFSSEFTEAPQTARCPGEPL